MPPISPLPMTSSPHLIVQMAEVVVVAVSKGERGDQGEERDQE